MRIGLYGMPTAGKTYILDRVDFLEVVVGSRLLREYDPDFDKQPEYVREKDRRDVAKIMMSKGSFIMDGHYAFGDTTAFTDEEGEMYDIYLYLYIDPTIIRKRMQESDKNRKYLKYDIEEWQKREIDGLRTYCHLHNKDFYVLDNPPKNYNEDADTVVSFIREIYDGYSVSKFAEYCAEDILRKSIADTVILLDGDKTLTIEDSSNKVFGYTTHIYDGNFYTGYQTWKQYNEFTNYTIPDIVGIPVNLNSKVYEEIRNKDAFILTSGNEKIWQTISDQIGVPAYFGKQMAAETKLYVVKLLQASGKSVIAYGDGMNDYYMMKQADHGYLITKPDGRISRSLKGRSLEGITIV